MSTTEPTHRTREVPLPGLRCAGRVEPGEAEARVPVLRHGVAVPDQSRRAAQIEEIDLVKTLRELPDSLRGWQAEKRSVRCQSCRAVMVFDPTRVAQNCEFCGSPALVDYEEIKEPISPQSLLPFRVARYGRARADSPLVREQVVRAGQAEVARARGHGARRLPAVLDVRRAGDLPVACRGGPLLLHDRDVPRQPGPHADAAGAARALGAGRGHASTTSSTTSQCRDRRGCASICCGRSSRSRRRNWCRTTPRWYRASSSSTTRWCCSTPRSAQSIR